MGKRSFIIKLLIALTLAALLALTVLPVFADDLVLITDDTGSADTAGEQTEATVYAPNDPALERVIDDAGALDDAQEAALRSRVKALIERYGLDVVILITDTTGSKDIESFCDDYYDDNGYGVGDGCDGFLFCINASENEAYISTTGRAIDAITDYGRERIFDYITDEMRSRDYYGALSKFFDVYADYSAEIDPDGETVDSYMESWQNGKPIDTYEEEKAPGHGILRYVICVAIGLIAALIVTGSMKAKLKTVAKQQQAENYCKRDTFDLMDSKDTFLYSSVTKTPRSTDTTRSGGGFHGGGSSTHFGSSGTTHGGGGRKF